jgi:hypothetical protein
MTTKRIGRVVWGMAGAVLVASLAAPAGAGQAATPLPAGGGEPGKVYLAQQKALKAKDVAALKKLVSAARAKEMDTPDFQEMLGMISEMAPSNVQITGGTQTGDTATLSVTGDGGGEKMKGEVSMVKEATGWKVEKESWKN